MNQFTTKHGTLHNACGIETMRGMAAGSVDCIISDVPYRVISGGNKNPNAPKGMLTANDGMAGLKFNGVKPEDYLPEMFRVLKNGGDCYIFTNDKNIERVLREARKVGFGFHTIVMWRKNNKNPSRYFMQCCEYVLYFYKKPARTINDCGTAQFIDMIDENGDFETLPVIAANNPSSPKKHPNEKPVEFMEVLIENSTHYGQVVFDPFAGSAPTLIAARNVSRRFLGCELDPAYFYGACGRIAP